MKIEVGQYVRANGFIGIVIEGNNGFIRIKDLNGEICLREKRLYNKVANTPQELIQVGDLVYDGHYLTEVQLMFPEINQLAIPYDSLLFKNIIKIYTPNEDKSQYTLQYSKEERI